jgi:hypothetical protein
LPVHPGVVAYLNSGEQSFFDEFQKYFYLGGMVLSVAGSAIALLVGRLNRKKSESDLRQIDRLIELADKALAAQASELKALEGELNRIYCVVRQETSQRGRRLDRVFRRHRTRPARHRETTRSAPARADRRHASTRIVNRNCCKFAGGAH